MYSKVKNPEMARTMEKIAKLQRSGQNVKCRCGNDSFVIKQESYSKPITAGSLGELYEIEQSGIWEEDFYSSGSDIYCDNCWEKI